MVIQNEESTVKHSKVILTGELFFCGLLSGVLQAAVFNPWDRALYLSVKHCRRFLDEANFKRPFEGLVQTITQRSVSAGLYFPLESIFKIYLEHDMKAEEYLSRQSINFLAGNLAGVTNGFFMNPLTTIKYHSWGSDRYYTFWDTAAEMYSKGKFRPFFTGTVATAMRDFIFGGVFALLRHEFRHYGHEYDINVHSFIVDVAAGCCATLASSPLNYVRNIKYATPPGVPHIPAVKILKDLMLEAYQQRNIFQQLHFLQDRLKIGWGTARVGCGMAFASVIYSYCVDNIDPNR